MRRRALAIVAAAIGAATFAGARDGDLAPPAAGSAMPVCIGPAPGVLPLVGGTDVPTNAVLTSFAGHAGRYDVAGTGVASTVTASEPDPGHTIHAALGALPPHTAIRVTWQGDTITTFMTGADPDLAPPPAPDLEEVTATVRGGRSLLAVRARPAADIAALRITIEGEPASPARLPPGGGTLEVSVGCPGGLRAFATNRPLCVHVQALDLADNASPEVVTCTKVVDTTPAPIPPESAPARELPPWLGPYAVWSVVALLLLGLYVARWKRVRARYRADASTWSVPAERVMEVALRVRTFALASAIAAILATVALDALSPWYAAPAALVPVLLASAVRGSRIRSILRRGGYAKTDADGQVYILLGPTPRTWLVVHPRAFEPEVPTARVHRDA